MNADKLIHAEMVEEASIITIINIAKVEWMCKKNYRGSVAADNFSCAKYCQFLSLFSPR